MSVSDVFARVVAVIGGTALLGTAPQGRLPGAGLGQRARDSTGQATGSNPDTQDADSPGLERGANTGHRGRT